MSSTASSHSSVPQAPATSYHKASAACAGGHSEPSDQAYQVASSSTLTLYAEPVLEKSLPLSVEVSIAEPLNLGLYRLIC